MKAYGGVDAYSHILTLALVGGDWSASCPSRFNPRERTPGNDWSGGWVGTRAGLNMEKILDPSGTRNSDTLAVQPIASLYGLYRLGTNTPKVN
jgi:hypothetical protein